MGLFRNIVVFDFETTGVDPQKCDPVQVAAMVIDPRTLEFMPDSEFNIMMRPPALDEMSVEEYMASDAKLLDTIKWHGKNQKKTPEEVAQSWKDAPSQREAWAQFINFVNKYNWKGKPWFAPIPAGMNIRGFDMAIYHRLNEQYKIKMGPFWPRDKIDLLDLCFYWFENLPDPPPKYNMDTLRPWFGLSDDNAHDALQDVKDTGRLIIKFMRLHRSVSQKVQFKDGFKNG